MQHYYPTGTPIRGRCLNTFSDVVKPSNSDCWSVMKNATHDIRLPDDALNMTRLDFNAALIFEITSTICMLLRLKQFTQRRNMDFTFMPLEDIHGTVRKRKDHKTMTTLEIMDNLIYAMNYEVSDGFEATPRQSLKVSSHEDDEGLAEKCLEKFYTDINKSSPKTIKKFKKKLGRMFTSAICFIQRNGLVCKVYSWQKYMIPNLEYATSQKEKDDLIHDENIPNYRFSLLTTISFYTSTDQETRIDSKKKEAFARLYDNTFEILKVNI